jgi:hypothetical protein
VAQGRDGGVRALPRAAFSSKMGVRRGKFLGSEGGLYVAWHLIIVNGSKSQGLYGVEAEFEDHPCARRRHLLTAIYYKVIVLGRILNIKSSCELGRVPYIFTQHHRERGFG